MRLMSEARLMPEYKIHSERSGFGSFISETASFCKYLGKSMFLIDIGDILC